MSMTATREGLSDEVTGGVTACGWLDFLSPRIVH
jgi:hypothetical protein